MGRPEDRVTSVTVRAATTTTFLDFRFSLHPQCPSYAAQRTMRTGSGYGYIAYEPWLQRRHRGHPGPLNATAWTRMGCAQNPRIWIYLVVGSPRLSSSAFSNGSFGNTRRPSPVTCTAA